MRKIILFLFCMLVICSCNNKQKTQVAEESDSKDKLVVYSYDSFIAEWGIGPKIKKVFEEKYNCEVILEGAGDVGQLLNRTIMEKEDPRADIVIGIDNTFLANALQESLFIPQNPQNLSKIDKKYLFDSTNHLIPFDYGYFAFVYDSEIVKNPPRSFGEMQDGKWEKQLLIIDPRTSSPGKGLLLWSIAAFGEGGYGHFWRSIKNNILTIPSSWGDAYNMFQAGEAPIVLSYSTSPAYHIENDDTYRYKAFIPEEGAFMQVEGAGVVRNCKNQKLAEKFIEFMLSKDFQELVPKNQWMYPVNNEIELPESFKTLPNPTKDLTKNISSEDIMKKSEKWLERWVKLVTKK